VTQWIEDQPLLDRRSSNFHDRQIARRALSRLQQRKFDIWRIRLDNHDTTLGLLLGPDTLFWRGVYGSLRKRVWCRRRSGR
jgi:hypothetical protein